MTPGQYISRREERAMAQPSIVDYSKVKLKLNNGTEMPAIGLGTYRIRHEADIMKAIDCALNAGYRMFDTAAVYGNEQHIGKAFKILLPKYDLQREDIFITTKLSPSDHGKTDVVGEALQKSLENLMLKYVDMFLIHFPGTPRVRAQDERNRELRLDTWRAMETLYDEGLAYAIGVSNFTEKHLDELSMHRLTVPAVNQVEWHPYYHQDSLLEYCKQRDIVVQGYCPFGGLSASNASLLQDPVVNSISKKFDVTPAQVLLNWSLQQDVAVIPKSVTPEHIVENISMKFHLGDDDMKALSALGEKHTKYTWDPSSVA